MVGWVWGCRESVLGWALKEGKQRRVRERGRAQDSVSPASRSPELTNAPLRETASVETVSLPQMQPDCPGRGPVKAHFSRRASEKQQEAWPGRRMRDH